MNDYDAACIGRYGIYPRYLFRAVTGIANRIQRTAVDLDHLELNVGRTTLPDDCLLAVAKCIAGRGLSHLDLRVQLDCAQALALALPPSHGERSRLQTGLLFK